jgi:hypothetical protein
MVTPVGSVRVFGTCGGGLWLPLFVTCGGGTCPLVEKEGGGVSVSCGIYSVNAAVVFENIAL